MIFSVFPCVSNLNISCDELGWVHELLMSSRYIYIQYIYIYRRYRFGLMGLISVVLMRRMKVTAIYSYLWCLANVGHSWGIIYIYNIVIHRIWAVLQSDWLNYSPYISSAKKKMAVQKLHEVCDAEKRKIFALRKIIVQGKTLKKIWQVSKIHLLHRN
jgi:hypothetical protein